MDVTMDIERNAEDSLLTIESDLNSDVLAKLRRLRIQESILAVSLHKCANIDQNDYAYNIDSTHCTDWKTYYAKVKNCTIDINHMFEDIKIATRDTGDNLKNIDIDEIKKDVLNLDVKIRSFEDFIKTELLTLQRNEEELLTQMCETPNEDVKIKGRGKIPCKQYNDVVPSPVRVMINSPLKCAEVQNFQEFISKSKNRYGGWDEYHHNTFVQIWNKFYEADDVLSLERNMNAINNNKLLLQFRHEVLEKIRGITSDDILLHSKWYSKFCYLKMSQQVAIDKWRENKRKMKRPQGKVNHNASTTSSNGKLCKKQYENEDKKMFSSIRKGLVEEQEFVERKSSPISTNSYVLNEEINSIQEKPSIAVTNDLTTAKFKSRATFLAPTKQWIYRCNSVDEMPRNIHNNIENVDKLCIPKWRMCLHEQ